MRILDRSMTPRDAAKFYADHYSADDPRFVGRIETAPDGSLRFQFVNGMRWYTVRMMPDGYEVTPD